MRASRLLSILITLQLRGRVSARALAQQFEVSKRTILRDIDALSAAGVPVYGERGAAGGFALHDGWRTQLTGLTGGEAEALLLAGVPVAAADLGLGATAQAVRLKLLAALPADASTAARRVAERFHVDHAPWHQRPSASRDDLRLLAQAVWECRQVRLRYESWSGAQARTLEPLGVVLKAGVWYFVAQRRGRATIHRLDKARDLTLLEKTFERPREFDLAAAWRTAVESFEAGLIEASARVRVRDAAMSRLDRLGAAMAEPIRAAPVVDGWREAEAPIEGVAHAASLILGFGDGIEVLSPPELREELARRAQAVVAFYRTPDHTKA